MKQLNQLFSSYNDGFSGKVELEFTLYDDGLVIEKLKNGKTYTHPFIIPGVTENEIKLWAYNQNPVYITIHDHDGVPSHEVKVELRDIELDDQLFKAYYYNHLHELKKLNEDGTY